MRGAFLVCAAALTGAAPLTAQTLSMRLGGVHARYAGDASGTAFSIAPRAEWGEGRQRAALEGNWARFGGGGWVVQGGGDAAASLALGRLMAIAAVAGANGSRLDNGTWSANAQGALLLGRAAGPFLFHAGGTAGWVRRVGGSDDPSWGAIAAVATRPGAVTGAARVQRTVAGPDRFTDVTALAGFGRGRVRLDVSGGARLFDARVGDAVWQLQATTELVPAMVLETAVGRWPRSPDGFTEGFFVSAGIRLVRPARRAAALVERVAAGRVRVTVPVRGAARVAIAGEWNAWDPAPMQAAGTDRWSVELQLAPGAHKFAIVVDGERWIVPAGVPKLPDGFGGEVGLLVVG